MAMAGLFTLSFTACNGGNNEDNADDVGDGDGDSTGDGDTTADTTGDGDTTADTTGDGDGDTTMGDCADPSDPAAPVVQVTGDITADTTWTCDSIYKLAPDTQVFVTGATLTIDPGTTIKGLPGSALVVEKDGTLEANGTADAPVVMTSNSDTPVPGDWGGLVFLGSATINLEGGVGMAEGFANAPTYGGNDDAHDCGTLTYVRVEYAGFAISEGNELNGITFYACGSDTTVHHVQSHMGLDDGIEFFGGAFDLDHVVVTGANDDSLDMDQGFGGTIQYAFIHQDPTVGDNAFEASNQALVFDAPPLTSPTICNATAVGSGGTGEKSKGFTFKEGNEASITATIFTNATNEAGLLADESTWEVLDGGGITLANDIFFANGAPQFESGADSLDAAGFEAWVLDAANANLTSDPGLASATWGDPDPTPSGDVAGDGTVGAGCEATSYIGAVDPAGENWTAASWINYAP
ncbi:hypothetical protein ACNOYE_14845 [Nannocystaceae bacterium ST9]